jgi:hypothetical protein
LSKIPTRLSNPKKKAQAMKNKLENNDEMLSRIGLFTGRTYQ